MGRTNKTIITLIGFVLLLGVVSAIYAGECLKVNLSSMESLNDIIYTVVGNSSNLDGLTIDLDDNMANICTVPNYRPDSFTIIFIDNSTNEVIKEVTIYRRSDGGTRTVYLENKTFVEVDKYIDREVIKESDPKIITIDNTKTDIPKDITTGIEKESKIKQLYLWIMIIILILSVIYLSILLYYFKENKKEVELEMEEDTEEKKEEKDNETIIDEE